MMCPSYEHNYKAGPGKMLAGAAGRCLLPIVGVVVLVVVFKKNILEVITLIANQ